MTQFTANVKAGSIMAPNFSVDTLPALFTIAGINSIHVQTSSETVFEGFPASALWLTVTPCPCEAAVQQRHASTRVYREEAAQALRSA